MTKIKVVISGLHYSVTMMRYFIEAFERRDDCEVFTVGPYFGSWIPWNNGMMLPDKYLKPPDAPLPRTMAGMNMHPEMVKDLLPKDIDLFLQVDAGWRFSARPPGKIVAHVQTDPHVLKAQYQLPKSYSDVNFCMQGYYMEGNEILLPYAVAPWWVYPEELPKEHDVCLIGLQYPKRIQLEKELERKGYRVKSGIGIVFDEYRTEYNKSNVALSWSSLMDLPNRVWEAFGMALPLVTNRLPDLHNWFVEGEHYLGFDGADEAVAQIDWIFNNYDDALSMAHSAYRKVMSGGHTWDDRVEQILKDCRFL